MDDAFKEFFGPHTLIFAAVCWIGTFFIRRVVEARWPWLRKAAGALEGKATYSTPTAMWWNQVVLYTIPPALGAVVALLNVITLPVSLQSTGSRVLFGVVIGFFSGYLFKIFKPLIVRIFGLKDSDLPAGSVPPPAGD